MRGWPRALLVPASLALVACGGQGTASDAAPASAAEVESIAPSSQAEAAEEPFAFGQLTAGTRYVLDTEPQISFIAPEAVNAFPAPGGVNMAFGEVNVRFVTGAEEIYVAGSTKEPIGETTEDVLAAFEANDRIDTRDSGRIDLGNVSAAYVDALVPYFGNEEGGGPILSAESAYVLLVDRTTNRIFVVEHPDGLAFVIVSAPEDTDIDEAVGAVAALLASVVIGQT